VVLEDFKGGGLIDDTLLFLRIFTRFAKFPGSGHRGEAFIDKGQRETSQMSLEFLSKLPDLGGTGPLRAVHAERQAEDDALDFPFGDHFQNAGNNFRPATINGLDRMNPDPEFIGRSKADAGLAVVDGQNGVIHFLKGCPARHSFGTKEHQPRYGKSEAMLGWVKLEAEVTLQSDSGEWLLEIGKQVATALSDHGNEVGHFKMSLSGGGKHRRIHQVVSREVVELIEEGSDQQGGTSLLDMLVNLRAKGGAGILQGSNSMLHPDF